ncbi:hypothetical protein THAOC_03956 [Thalassiosira oceanica]|uniref:UDP-galactose transporter n=1 Tax=Thalassiosira oceanica TaxID=159749 RepID=K0TA17_THAOC|nr:hypothetical protein THAOC_03956 [Thalassiosira oceanica]|eukprot:EJK74370.1 hypothetical protein THAOC_03956 [Thalassiosira oceanica]
MYLGSTAVCCDEAMKLVTCLCILTFTYIFGREGDEGGNYSQLSTSTADDDGDDDEESSFEDLDANGGRRGTIGAARKVSYLEYLRSELQFDYRMAGIAAIYTVQKNLLYLAISNLDAAVFQVTYQAKILTTAVFSVLLLGRKLTYIKLAALVILFVGVAVVQADKVDENSSKSEQEQNRWVGVMAVLGACCTSGFGGVYFELVLKPRVATQTKAPSVWAKNVQLSTYALIIALATAFVKDGNAIRESGFFQGYSLLVLSVVTLEAGGGLVVAAVIKYADNILKSFATAVSIVTSTIVSALVFGFKISLPFMSGCALVFVAVGMYSKKDEPSRFEELPKKVNEIAMQPIGRDKVGNV